jgi:uncharacterized cupredoxin-like copper-binding protein
MYRICLIFLFSTLVLFSFTTFAETNQPNNIEVLIGIPGDPSKVSRTVNLKLLDNMFLPPELIVSKGETIRIVIHNLGSNTHRFLIGSADDLKKAAKMRQKNENLIRVNPGEQKELIWEFVDAGTIDFACPIKDHFKTMRGRIIVK